ncbi:MAG TPA: ABC transporter ATP-binding protein [Bacteroidetes bacterium]|nr:ABC transporter ATP-binding protein [Bacteroidota bacterium]
MNRFWYIIKRLVNYKYWLLASVVSNIFMSVFTIASIPIFIPFFDLLFNPERNNIEKSILGPNPGLKEYLNYQLSRLIEGRTPEEALIYVILAFFLTFLLKNVFRYLGAFFITPARNGFVRDLRRDLYHHIISLPVLFFKDRKKGDLLSRMSMDMQEIENSIMNGFDALIKSPLIIIGAIFIMMVISFKLTIFALVLLPVTIFVIGGISRKMKEQSSEAQGYLGKLLSVLDETIGSIKIIKSFNADKLFISRFDRINDDYKKVLTKLLWRKYLGSPLAEVLGVVVISVLMYYSAILVFQGEIKAATFFAFIYAFFSIIEPAKAFSTAYYSFQKGAAALDRVEEIMDIKNDIFNSNNPIGLKSFNSFIEFRNIDFKYPDSDEFVLKNINLKIKKGEKIAIVGLSGAGKSTLVDLLSRFYEATNGEIKIDDYNIKDIDLKHLRSLIAIVSQEPLLFNDSVVNNIVLGNPVTDEDRLQFALETSLVNEFVESLDAAKNIIIGDQGTKLSGGQKQRIAIARAIYKNAEILVLDEATSSLDSESEEKVQKALNNIMKDKTSIIIAHRLSTIKSVDRIVVLENGKIIEEGSPQELIKSEGQYHRFLQLQQL